MNLIASIDLVNGGIDLIMTVRVQLALDMHNIIFHSISDDYNVSVSSNSNHALVIYGITHDSKESIHRTHDVL